MYNENYKLWLKEIRIKLDIPHSRIRRPNIVNMSILHKVIWFNAIPTKIPIILLAEIEKSTLIFIWSLHVPQIAK